MIESNNKKLIAAGGMLANIAYNLAQRVGQQLTPAEVESLSAGRQRWDEACRVRPPAGAVTNNPHTGTPRDPRDIASDPQATLCVKPGEPLRAAQPAPTDAGQAQALTDGFQARVQPWMMACFGAEISADKVERNHRFFEESAELVQACGMTAGEAHQLVDYVYGRDIGEPSQEVGGVMVTLAALCLAQGMDMHQCGETELARIWTKVEQIRAKQAAKPKHSPLPAAPAQSAAPDERKPEPFMFAIMGPDGKAHFDEQCVDPTEEALYLLVNGLNDSPDAGYSIVPVYTAPPAPAAPPEAANATWDASTLVTRLYNEHPTYSLAVEAGAQIQELRQRLAAQPEQQAVAAQEVLKYREQGRAEALDIILSLDAETGLDDCINSAQCPASGEYDSHWDETKLRELFSVDDATYAAFDKAEAAYWEYQGHKDEADRAKAFAVNMHSSGRIREVLAKAGEYDLMGQLCTPAAPAPTKFSEDAAEALEILDQLIDSITKHGNYSQEATLIMLGQLRQCFAPAGGNQL